jgi:hypothetical protein
LISAEELREMLVYDPETGVFTWRVMRGKARVGAKAGNKNGFGYIVIMVRHRNYRAHRLAWLYVHGEWPAEEIDHRNGDPSDNRLTNLRLATRSQNIANTRLRIDTTSGVKGVTWNKRDGNWMAQIRVNGKQIFLGYFDAIEDAAEAYRIASKEHFGDFANTSIRGATGNETVA